MSAPHHRGQDGPEDLLRRMLAKHQPAAKPPVGSKAPAWDATGTGDGTRNGRPADAGAPHIPPWLLPGALLVLACAAVALAAVFLSSR